MASPIQLLLKGDDGQFILNESALREVVDKDDVRDRHVVVVSVVGAFRKGKSFLINFLLRYLHNLEEEDWFGDDNSELVRNFEWRAGEKRTTTGILLWPEVFLIGKNLAVILLDTQGTFDEHATMSENTQIFALSTLISSVQIYNISQQIQLDHLQHLQYFVEYGRLALEEVPGSKPFQRLVFLIRDWQHRKDKEFGLDGGSKYLKQWMHPVDSKNAEIKQIGESLRKCYTDVSCYLMPHPGEKVASGYNFTGNFADISEDFKEHIKSFVEEILAMCNLEKKRIGGQAIKLKDFTSYIKMYIEHIQSDKLPHPTSLLEATASVHMTVSIGETKDLYVAFMNDTFKSGKIIENLEQLHENQLRVCLQHFDSKRKLQGVDVGKFRTDLVQELQAEYVKLCSLNEERIEIEKKAIAVKSAVVAVEKWLQIYQTAMSELCTGPAKQVRELETSHSNQKSKCLDSFSTDVRSYHYQDIVQEHHAKLEKYIDEWHEKCVIPDNEKKLIFEDQQMISNVMEKCKDMYSTYMINMCGGRAHVKTFEQVHSTAIQSSLQYFQEKTTRSLSSREELAKHTQVLTEDIEHRCADFKNQNDEKEVAESEDDQREMLRDAEQRARDNYHKVLLLSSGRPVSDSEFLQFEEKVRHESLSIFQVVANECDSKIALEIKNLLIQSWNDSQQEYIKSNKVKFDQEQELLKNTALQMGKSEARELFRNTMEQACSSQVAVKDLKKLYDNACDKARAEFIKHAKDVEDWDTYWQSLQDGDILRLYEKYTKENDAKLLNEQSNAVKTKVLNSTKKKYRTIMLSRCRESQENTSNIHSEVLEELVEIVASKLENQKIESSDLIDELKNELDNIYEDILSLLSNEDEEICKDSVQTALRKYKHMMDQNLELNSQSGSTSIERIHAEASDEAIRILQNSNVKTVNVLRKYKNNLVQEMESLFEKYKNEITKRREMEDNDRKRKEDENRTKLLNDAKSEVVLKYQVKMNEHCSGQLAVENLGSLHAKIMSTVMEDFNVRARETGETNLNTYILTITKNIQDYYDIIKKENDVKTKKELKVAENKLNSLLKTAQNRYYMDLENLGSKTISQFRSAELIYRENAYASFNDFLTQDENEKYSDLVDKYKSKLDEYISRSKSKISSDLSERILQEESEKAKNAYISGLQQYNVMTFDSPVAMSSSHEQCKSDALKQFTASTKECNADGIRSTRQDLEERIDAYYRNLQVCLEERKRNKNAVTSDESLKTILTVVAAGAGFLYGGPMGAVAGAGMVNTLVGGGQSNSGSETNQPNQPTNT